MMFTARHPALKRPATKETSSWCVRARLVGVDSIQGFFGLTSSERANAYPRWGPA